MKADPKTTYGTWEIDFPWWYPSPGGAKGANGRKGVAPTYERWKDDRIVAFSPPFKLKDGGHVWVWTPPVKWEVVTAWAKGRKLRDPRIVRYWIKPHPANGLLTQNDVEMVRLFYLPPWTDAPGIKAALGYFPRATLGDPHGGAGGTREIVEARRVHSAKPNVFYEETYYLSPGPHLSLFQRFERPGWYGAGAEYERGATVFP